VATRTLAVEEILALLTGHPKRIAELTAGRPAAHLHTAPGPDDWSANEVLAHIRACADVWGGAIARIVAEDGPALPGLSPRTWMKRTGYPDLAFPVSLRAFTEQRADLLALLEPLPADGWSRTATVLARGQRQQKSVLAFANQLASHEGIHVSQIAAAVAAFR
jgi:hypothetical protein